eukprot:symbB.v1.2.032253.t1/scaffold3727.1/size51393/6
MFVGSFNERSSGCSSEDLQYSPAAWLDSAMAGPACREHIRQEVVPCLVLIFLASLAGSGALISARVGNELQRAVLTAAHVQRTNDRYSGEKFRAHVVAVCHEIDLALLLLEDDEVLEEMTPLTAKELPRVFDKVRVVGYPVGGEACSVTEGVVSRVEVQEYSHSLHSRLALTVDAAINSGNSGGPLVDALTGHVVGVAFQKMVARGVELQGHAVPAPVIQRFLEDVASALPKASIQGASSSKPAAVRLRMPSLGCDYQSLEPMALRQKLGLGGRKGILVSRLHHATEPPALQPGDVLLTFNGHHLDELGFSDLFGRRLHFGAARDLCHVGSEVQLDVWRDGQERTLAQVLRPAEHLVPRGQYDTRPRFFIVGGLVFQPLSNEYLQGWAANERPAHLQERFARLVVCTEGSSRVKLLRSFSYLAIPLHRETKRSFLLRSWVTSSMQDMIAGGLEHLLCRTSMARQFEIWHIWWSWLMLAADKETTYLCAAMTDSKTTTQLEKRDGEPGKTGSEGQPTPVVSRMDELMNLVHCVFVGHGYQRESKEENSGIHKLHYAHEQKQSLRAVYVPLQKHLVTYVSIDGFNDSPTKATVQVGMPVAAVQAKIDYLLLYPLLYRQCLPTLESTPPEALFGLLCGLAIPALASLGRTCRSMSSSVLQDDLVWLRVAMSLPQSPELEGELAALKRREQKGQALPKGIYKGVVRTEVRRLRREAEEERRRKQESLARQRGLRDPLMMEPPRRPRPGFPGLGGGRPFMVGGDYDLDPRGLGGRPNPFGGGMGGGGFGGRTVTEVVPIDRVFVQLNTRNTGPHLARKVRGGIVIAFLHRNVEMPLLRSSHCCTLSRSQGCPWWRTFSHCATITGPGRGGNLKTQAVRSCCPVQADKRICAIYGLPRLGSGSYVPAHDGCQALKSGGNSNHI